MIDTHRLLNVAISDYLRPLCENKYSIDDLPSMLSSVAPLQNEGHKPYFVESLIKNKLIEETINFITELIYVPKKMTPICLKLFFGRLLIKLAKDGSFKFNNRFLTQLDGCTIGWLLSVTFSDIYMVKMENFIFY